MARFVFIELLNNPDVENPPARAFEAPDLFAAIEMVKDWATCLLSVCLITDSGGVTFARRESCTSVFVI